jgi:F-type H+-transporting ATPase subunit alpha
LRLDLAQYRELEAFAAFGSDLDKASKAQLERGARLVELLKQPQYAPFPVERQVVSVWAGTSGQLDDVPVADIRKFEREFLDYIGHQHKGIYEAITSSGQLSEDTIASLERALADFKKTFETSSGKPLDKSAEAMDAGEEGQESVTAHRPPKPERQG